MGRTLSEVEVSTIMEMVLKGLIYIHKLNLIHRDIKGANIMLSEEGYAKLGDFGIGIQMTDDEYRTSKKGSPHWMSPQVILNKNYDMKTDIWSLGITCLELVEGEPPFADLNPDEVMEQIANNPPKAEDIIDVKEHTEDFIDFVNLCLEINPIKRPSADILIKHPFIKKYSKKKEYLKELIEKHIDEVEKFRIDREEYLASKEYLENENNENIKDNNIDSESIHIKNYYSVGNNIINNNNVINNGGINQNIENNGNEEFNFNNGENFDCNYEIYNKEDNFQSNDFKLNQSLNKKAKNISVLSNDNNLNLSDCSFKKNIIDKNQEIKTPKNANKDKIKNSSIDNDNKDFIIYSENDLDLNNNMKNTNGNKKTKKKLIYNNSNSNGGKIESKNEDIEESSDEERLRPINQCLINANYENNESGKYNIDIKKVNNIPNKGKIKIDIPPLNIKEIINNKNKSAGDLENLELNTHDSPTHDSSVSLFKMHNKYFD